MKKFFLMFILFIFSSASFAQIRSVDISQSTGNNWTWRGKTKVGTGTPSVTQTEGSLYVNGILESANAVYFPGVTPNGTLMWINASGQVKGIVLGTGVAFNTTTGTLTATGTGISGSLTATRIPYAMGASALADNANLTWDNTNNIFSVFGTPPVNATSSLMQLGATPIGANSSGQMLWINAPVGFAGNVIGAQIDGATPIFTVDSVGKITVKNNWVANSMTGVPNLTSDVSTDAGFAIGKVVLSPYPLVMKNGVAIQYWSNSLGATGVSSSSIYAPDTANLNAAPILSYLVTGAQFPGVGMLAPATGSLYANTLTNGLMLGSSTTAGIRLFIGAQTVASEYYHFTQSGLGIISKGTVPSFTVAIDGSANRTIGLERNTSANGVGRGLTVSAGSATVAGAVTTINATPTAGGTGYLVNDLLTITTGSGTAKVRVNTVSAGVITAVSTTPETTGSGYSTGTGQATSGGAGTGATINVTAVSTSTNVVGGNHTIQSGVGTGNATGSQVIIQTPTPAASGATDQSLATRATIDNTALTTTVPITSNGVVTGSGLKATALTSQSVVGTDSSGNLIAGTVSGGVKSVTKVIGITGSTDTDYVIGGTGCAEIGACVNTAVAALPAVGGTIIIREGNYTQTSAIVIAKSNVTLEYTGKAGTITRGWAGTTVNDGSMVVVGDASSQYTNIHIKGLRLEGVKATYANAWNSAITLRGASNTTNELDSSVENCTLTNHKGPTINALNNLTHSVIYNNTISGGGDYGIVVIIGNGNFIQYNNVTTCTTGIRMEQNGTPLFPNTVSNNKSYSNSASGYDLIKQDAIIVKDNFASSNTGVGFTLSSKYMKLTNNESISNGGDGYYINTSQQACIGCAITGNISDTNTGHGFNLGQTTGNEHFTFSGNIAETNTQSGINFTSAGGTSNSVISNNTASNNGGSGSNDGIAINSGGNIISNNKVTDTAGTGHAINIAGGASNTLIGNDFSGTGAADIADSITTTRWVHQWDGTRFLDKNAALTIYQNGPFFTATADATIANTVTETSTVGGGIGTKTLPANYFAIGKTIRVKTRGYLSDTGTPTLNFKFKLGSTQIVATGALTLGSGVSNVGYDAEFELTCRTIGASGTVYGQGRVIINGVAFNAVATSTATVDTTGSLVVDVSGTWGTASASNTVTTSNATLEALN